MSNLIQQINYGQIDITASANGQALVSNGTALNWTSVAAITPTVGAFYSYDMDDLYPDGYNNLFVLKYNNSVVYPPNPWAIQVELNGMSQKAFIYNSEVFWLSQVYASNKGYIVVTANTYVKTSDSFANNVLRFAEAPPLGSEIFVRYNGGINNLTTKIYPFKPLDIMMGF